MFTGSSHGDTAFICATGRTCWWKPLRSYLALHGIKSTVYQFKREIWCASAWCWLLLSARGAYRLAWRTKLTYTPWAGTTIPRSSYRSWRTTRRACEKQKTIILLDRLHMHSWTKISLFGIPFFVLYLLRYFRTVFHFSFFSLKNAKELIRVDT